MRYIASLWLLATATVAAQPIPAGVKVGLSDCIRYGYAGLKSNITSAAEKMPAAGYGFVPSKMLPHYTHLLGLYSTWESSVMSSRASAPIAMPSLPSPFWTISASSACDIRASLPERARARSTGVPR